MFESLAIVIYTGLVYGVFAWIILNDGKGGIAEQVGPFRIRNESNRRGDGEEGTPRPGRARRRQRPRGPGGV